MNTRFRLATPALVMTVALGSSSAAIGDEGFYCGEKIIETNMSTATVLKLCGQPTEQLGDRWIYERGSDKFTVVLHIAPDDTVSLIEMQPAD